MNDRLSDSHTLTKSLRKLSDLFSNSVGERTQFQNAFDSLHPFSGIVQPAKLANKMQIIGDFYIFGERIVFGDVSETPANFKRLGQVDSQNLGLAVVGLQITGEDPHRRGFPGAIGSKESHHLPLRNLKAHTINRQGCPETSGNVLNLDHRSISISNTQIKIQDPKIFGPPSNWFHWLENKSVRRLFHR